MATKRNTSTNEAAPAEVVAISPPKFRSVEFDLVGTAPLVICKFSAKSREEMKANQAAGSQSRKGKKREAKDFDAVYNAARHVSQEGWDGIHAGAFRSAMIDACRLVGFKMTQAKMGVFVEADGLDAEEGIPLVRVIGAPKRHEAVGRNNSGVPDIRIRPMYWPWRMKLRMKFDADMFSLTDVTNLLMRVGMQVGIGEGRPFSKNSAGQGWGTFEIDG